MVSNLPKHKSVEQLRMCLMEHFESKLTEHKMLDDKRLRDRGESIKIVDNEDLTVFDIQFSLNNRKQIYWKKLRGKYARLKDKMENEVVFLKQIGKFKGKSKAKLVLKHKLLEKQFGMCNTKLEAIEDRIEAGKKREYAKYAFVTFNAEEGAVRCKKVYPDLGFLQRLTMRKMWMIELNGKLKRPIVKVAPEPSEIIWENLGIPYLFRLVRLFITSILTLVMLAGAFVLIYQGRVAQEQAELKYPEAECSGYIVSTNTSIPLDDIEYVTPASVERDVNWEYYNQTLGNTGKVRVSMNFSLKRTVEPRRRYQSQSASR